MQETPETMRRLQAIIDRTRETAGPVIARGFPRDREMSAEEFVAFWTPGRMACVSTTSAKGNVHAAPLDPVLRDGRFYLWTAPRSVRLRDHRTVPWCSISSWVDADTVVIVYGNAREVTEPHLLLPSIGSTDWVNPVTIEVTPERIYSVRPARE